MERIQYKIERFIRSGEGSFDTLALELFRYQFDQNGPYRAFASSQNLTPDSVRRWQDIPAVPIQAFKSSTLCTFPPNQAAAIFESSGTTGKTPSRHYLKTLTFYELSLKTHFESQVLPKGASLPFLILTPSPAEAPRSSLSWMMDVVKRKWGAPGSQYLIRNGRLDELWLSTFLQKSQVTGVPVLLMGTTLSFLAFFRYCETARVRFQLPKGSRLMDTGGMKGETLELTRPAFVDQVGRYLAIPAEECINEYGMCEMSSQFYGRGASSVLQGPAWVRTLVVDGCLRHYDLANVDSVMAIQTEDLGRLTSDLRTPNSEKSISEPCTLNPEFVLLGRAPAADLKGCSLSAEAYLK